MDRSKVKHVTLSQEDRTSTQMTYHGNFFKPENMNNLCLSELKPVYESF